jgi:hypothetical protein
VEVWFELRVAELFYSGWEGQRVRDWWRLVATDGQSPLWHPIHVGRADYGRFHRGRSWCLCVSCWARGYSGAQHNEVAWDGRMLPVAVEMMTANNTRDLHVNSME